MHEGRGCGVASSTAPVADLVDPSASQAGIGDEVYDPCVFVKTLANEIVSSLSECFELRHYLAQLGPDRFGSHQTARATVDRCARAAARASVRVPACHFHPHEHSAVLVSPRTNRPHEPFDFVTYRSLW